MDRKRRGARGVWTGSVSVGLNYTSEKQANTHRSISWDILPWKHPINTMSSGLNLYSALKHGKYVHASLTAGWKWKEGSLVSALAISGHILDCFSNSNDKMCCPPEVFADLMSFLAGRHHLSAPPKMLVSFLIQHCSVLRHKDSLVSKRSRFGLK